MSFFGSTPKSDTEVGRQAVTAFHNRAIYSPGYNETVDTLLSKIMKGKSSEFFLEGLGLAIREIGMGQSQVNDAMEDLAVRANGRIPDWNSFYTALSDRASKLTFVDYLKATPEIAGATALDVVKGAERLGNAVLDVGKFFEQFGPILAVGAILFIGYAYTRRAAGR